MPDRPLSGSGAYPLPPGLPQHAGRALAWAGAAAALAGIVAHDLLDGWRAPRSLVVVAACVLLAAWVASRIVRCSVATALALCWLALLPVFADPLPVLATLLAAAAALALGGRLLRGEGAGASCVLGLALAAGALAWLLPLPLHLRWTYGVACLALVAWQRHALADAGRGMREAWSAAVAPAPGSAAFAVLVLGLAGTSCWLPTLQHDDIGYHLYLPWSLLLDGRHPMDPEYHAWALAPWLADVVQAVPQVLAGAEARGPVNALWLVLAATGLWRLCGHLGGSPAAAWWTVATWASIPLTAALAGGMQTELPGTALLAWLVACGHGPPSRRRVLAMAVLAGALLATKLAAGAMALAMLPWLAWRQRSALRAGTVAAAAALVALVGGSSYAYAWAIAGNPLLPLANGYFASPYFPAEDFVDPRWHAGFDATLPWDLTFHTGRYLEAGPGAAGVVLVALAGVWLFALSLRRTRTLALLTFTIAAGMLATTQYLRYVYPLVALALPALVAALARVEPRAWRPLLALVVVAGLALYPRGHWMLGANALRHTLSARGADAPLLHTFAPERVLLGKVRDAIEGTPGATVLVMSHGGPMPAELGSRARGITWYDPSLAARAMQADLDSGGDAWTRLLLDEGVREIVLRPEELTPARRGALAGLGARREAAVGPFEWWRLPPEAAGP